MSGSNKTVKRESSDGELTETLKAYGEGPSTVREDAIDNITGVITRNRLGNIIKAKNATIQERDATIELLRKEIATHKAEIESIQQNLTNADEYRTEVDGLKEELKKTRKRANSLQKHRFSKVQDHQIVQEFKAPPLPTVDVDPVPVKTEEVDLDLKDIMAKGCTPFERIGAFLQEFMRKFGAGMSLPSLLELKYPRALNVMLDFLLCFSFTKRDVILSVKSSQYEEYLNNFHFELCCMFCQEKQYHIGRKKKSGNFYFKFAADDERHICSLSNLKQALLAQSRAQEETLSTFPKNMEILGDDVDGIRTAALLMGVAAKIDTLFGAMLSVLIRIDRSSDIPGERRIASDLDLKMDCIAAFNEGIKMEDMHRKVFSLNEEFMAAGGIVLPEYESFEQKWYERCYETASSALCSNSLNWLSNDKTSIPLAVTAVANFLLHKTNGSFLVGAFESGPELRFLFGNIDPKYSKRIRADPYDCSKATNPDRQARLLSAVNVEDDGPVNEFVNSDDFQGWNVTLSKETLMRLGKAPISDIPFDEGEMTSIIENMSEMNDLSNPGIDSKDRKCLVDTLFWCADFRGSGLGDKFIGDLFLDSTPLSGQFGTLLTLCGITVDNRVLPLAHMIHGGGEKESHSILFLRLVEKYIPLRWDDFFIISDQCEAIEDAHRVVFGRWNRTCVAHLLRDTIVSMSKNVTTRFHEMVHTLESITRSDTKRELIGMFPVSVRDTRHPAYHTINHKANLFCRGYRHDEFEHFTIGPVEQFHRTISPLKEGSVANMISQLAMLQMSAFNLLSKENAIDEPSMSAFGCAVLSLNISLALTMKVERTHRRRYAVSHNGDTGVSLHQIYSNYAKKLGRGKNYIRCRKAYLDSLEKCVGSYTCETFCLLCNADLSYCYCPHTLAVRLHASFPDMWAAARESGSEAKDYVTPLLERMTFAELVQLVGCHPVLYRGEVDKQLGVLFEDCIFEPAAINRWASEAVPYLLSFGYSAQNIDTDQSLAGSPSEIPDQSVKRRRLNAPIKREI
ncbi:hypothetical protein DAKH74_022750 [Maudiozyma humilis]|uniref:Transposase n=1 Tax=Maudiozyma humilis TaxID=51915 RepID=A0AAV5RVT0_MAUHU|nr:hypothetical protein DAKH74_022750 [Kazachstania humilis]